MNCPLMLDDRLIDIKSVSSKTYKKLGLKYYIAPDMEYIVDELLEVQPNEIQSYKNAANELYEMFEKAAQHVIDNNLWEVAGIPENAIEVITHSWRNRDLHPHLYGRFDLSGVIDGKGAKLIEFNADTATVLPESVVIQREQLLANKMDPSKQFNDTFKNVREQFKKLMALHPDREPTILISTLGHEEDYLNADMIAQAAERAGMETLFAELPDVEFDPNEGIFARMKGDEYLLVDFWFKLIPWEFIAFEEPELMDILTNLVLNDKVIILNPAYTMLFQSKAMLKILWDLYPNHPLLLKTTFSGDDFRRKEAYVSKVIYGREGSNITVFDPYGDTKEWNEGAYSKYPSVFQAYEQLPMDEDGDFYQAGVYFSGQASGLSYRRRDGYIIDEDSEFIGHFIK